MTTTLSTENAPKASTIEPAKVAGAEKSSTPLAPIAALNKLADLVVEFARPLAVPGLRIALGVIYVWFGALKIAGISPVDYLISAMVPFLPADVAVTGMGYVEVVLGAALIVGFGARWVAAAMVLHLAGTFVVGVFHPEFVYDGNPFAATFAGEFIAKNLILIAALVVVATQAGAKKVAR